MAFGSSVSVWLATSPRDCRQANADDDKDEAKEQAKRHHDGRRQRRSSARSGVLKHLASRRPESRRNVKPFPVTGRQKRADLCQKDEKSRYHSKHRNTERGARDTGPHSPLDDGRRQTSQRRGRMRTNV